MTTEAEAAANAAGNTEVGNQPGNTDPPAGTGQASGEGNGQPPVKTVPWFQQVIDRKAFEAREAKREAEGLRSDNAAKDAEIARLKGVTPTPPQNQPRLPQTQEEFDSAVDQRASQKAAQVALDQACNKIYVDGKAEFGEGFDQAVATLNQAAGGKLPDEFLARITKLEAPTKIIAKLGANPEEAVRILNLPPVEQAMELVRFETKAASYVPPVTKVPAPITPIGGQRNAPGDGQVDLTNGETPIDQWMKERENQWRKKLA